MAKKKFYVVWQGVQPGIYSSWDECKAQVTGFEQARYKSFETKEEAMSREYAIKRFSRKKKLELACGRDDRKNFFSSRQQKSV